MKPDVDMVETGSDRRWQKRLLGTAFLFFLIKGLLWLILPTAAALIYF